MFVEIFIALSCFLIQPTIHHFIGNFDECTASKVCNHTWTPVCGQLEEESSYRLFLDDCDLHEYNCDNNAKYVEVDSKVCTTKCTQRDQAEGDTPVTPPMPAAHVPDIKENKVSTIMTTEEIKTTKITSTKEVTETTKDKTDTSTIFVAPTTLKTTTEEPKTTNKQTSQMTTKSTATTTEATVITNVTSSNVTTVKPVIETTTTTELPEISSENNINDNENTIPEQTTSTTSTSVTPSAELKLDCYPKHCSMPSTWETTSVGETRDFVQILRERYGDGVKLLRDTTHFPKQPTYARKSAFIPGYHMERQKQEYLANQLETW